MSGKIDHPGARSGTVNRLKGINFTPTDTEATPTTGNMYYDLSEARLKHYNGVDWVAVNKTINYDRPGDGHYDVDASTMFLMQSKTTNGATALPALGDMSDSTFTAAGGLAHSTTYAKIGTSSIKFTSGTSDRFTSDLNTATDMDWGTGDFTFEFWVNPIGTDLGTVIMSQQYGATYTDSVSWIRWVGTATSGPQLQLNHSGTGNSQVNHNSTTMAAVAAGTWYHFAITRTGGSTHIWRDGVLDNSSTNLGSTNFGSPATDGNVTFGARQHGTGLTQWLYGYYDEIRVSNIARWTSAFNVY
jgi:hypothetical protein